jgi:undecaprenyl diphosphate synthase
MGLFVEALEREIAELDDNGVRVRFIGNREQLGAALNGAAAAAEQRTRMNEGLELVIAIAYGGRWDIAQAARHLAAEVRAGRLDPGAIDETTLAAALATAALPPVDLMIRTGGEQRLSNFLLWDLAYSELYFAPVLWPEFDRKELERAFEFFASRQRRFGRTGQQLGISAC